MDIIKFIKITSLILIFMMFFGCSTKSSDIDAVKSDVRIVSTYSAFTEILISIGARSTIVGATKNDADILNVKSVGTHLAPSLEAIISCDPNIVLLSRHREEHTLRLTESLEKMGINVLLLSPSTIDEVLLAIDTLGKISGNLNNSINLIKSISNDVSFVKRKVENISDSKKKRIFLEVRSEPNLLTCGKSSIAYDIIKTAGGTLVFDNPKKVMPVSIEKLYDLKIDFYFQQKGIMNRKPKKPKDVIQLKRLTAIQNDAFAIIDEKLISRPGPRVGEAAKIVYEHLYKEN